MKLSKETIEVLKNYGNINQGMMFRAGKIIRTVNAQKNILSSAEISEEFPTNFAVYDINNLLGVISVDDSPEFEFSTEELKIKGKGGRSSLRYGLCDADVIVAAPDKDVVIPSEDIKFNLSKDDLLYVLKINRLLSLPNIVVESDGSEVYIKSIDVKESQSNNMVNYDKLHVGSGDGSVYTMILKSELVEKLMPMDYEVIISSKGITQFKNQEKKLTYWITTEPGSTYQSA